MDLAPDGAAHHSPRSPICDLEGVAVWASAPDAVCEIEEIQELRRSSGMV
jgi:hypothetical protein